VHSGFATLVGRPNVGKSTLLNRILGQKVSIVSDKAQTTRNQVRGVLTRSDVQVVFVDTPGIHKPRTLLGARLNDVAGDAAKGVDVVVFTIDATAPVGKGDRFVAGLVPGDSICVVNKIDLASPEQVMHQLRKAGDMGFAAYHPVSATTGEGVDELLAAIVDRMPPGPRLYPDDMVTDVPEAFWIAELVREQLLHVTKEEVPHSVACRVTEWEWPERPDRAGKTGPRIRCEILVERDSQKGIVIGKGGNILKAVGTAVRAQLPDGAYLELFVKVDKDWQHRPQALQRLGY
jgi:GTP-binding protein Era